MTRKHWLIAAVSVVVLVCVGVAGIYLCQKNIKISVSSEKLQVNDRGARPGEDTGEDMRGGGMYYMDQVLAQMLGLEPDELRQKLSSGKTIEELAKEKDLTIKQLQEKVLSALKNRLELDVRNGVLSQEQAVQIYQRMESDISSGRWLQRPGPQGQPVQPSPDQSQSAQSQSAGSQ